MKSDEERLKELFEMKEKPTFNNTIRRAKALSTIRTVVVSLMIFVILGFTVLVSNATILNKMSNKEEDSLRDWFTIAMPNAYMGNMQVDDRIMVGQIDYVRYRFLGNKPIADGAYKEGYTYMPLINGIYGDMSYYLFNRAGSSPKDLEGMIKYNKAGKRVMKFYHPSISCSTYINDLKNLNDIGSNKLMEISLSFDKDYSIDEIQAMIPDKVTLNWYWVDTLSKDSKYNSNKSIFEEYDVYGIKALDNQGNPAKNPEQEFINAIMRGKGNKDYSNTYEKLFAVLSNGKDKISKDDLKIAGVVVSGDMEALKGLKDKSYIKAATIGAVSDKY